MENLNLGNLIAKYINFKPVKSTSPNNVNPSNFSANSSSAANIAQTTGSTQSSANHQMGALTGQDRSVYIKDLMQLPRNMNELLFMLQKNLNQVQFNRLFEQQIAARKNLLSQTQAQILAQLQGLTTSEMQTVMKSQINTQMASALKNLQLAAGQMINIADIAALIQTNGKDAVTKLILAMTAASKQGVTNLSQLKETAKLINASIALASTDNPAQTLKTLMLLYLPWLPLHEGAGFDLEIEASSGGGAEDESTIDTTTSLEPDTEKIQEYKEAEPYQDGLTVQEFANSQGFDAVADAYNYQGEDIRYSLKSIVSEMGYGLNSASCTTTSDGKPVISVGGTFDFSSGNISRGMIGVTYDPDGNNFYIQLSVIPTTGDYVAEFSSDTIPTLDEARQILADNL